MKRADYTGKTFGVALVIGPAEGNGHWITECQMCGVRTVRSRSAIRGLRCNASTLRGCAACKATYTAKRVPGTRPTAADNVSGPGDIGVVWDAIGFRSTEIGMLQQRFYLGML